MAVTFRAAVRFFGHELILRRRLPGGVDGAVACLAWERGGGQCGCAWGRRHRSSQGRASHDRAHQLSTSAQAGPDLVVGFLLAETLAGKENGPSCI